MNNKNLSVTIAIIACMVSFNAIAQNARMRTYCNPINIDYTYMIYNSDKDISYRSGADPAVVEFRGEYYMFVTRSMGYWHSTDLQNWNFIEPEKWYPQGSNAPAAHNYKDSVLYVMGDPSGSMSALYTDNPRRGDWKAVPAILHNLQDPALFIDDDGSAYIYWGSSNLYPIRGQRLNKDHRFIRYGEVDSLFNKDMDKHGWERFGENNSDTIPGYIEGPWMTKHNNKYYLQYGAPGTEFNVYADGVYIGDHPLGPFEYAPNNPVSFKPGGFMNGAGHGSTVKGPQDLYWHFASMALSYNVNWERRLCMFPLYFDNDDLMWSDTYFGDYPRYAPSEPGKAGEFAGWMLLSYKKPVTVSSSTGDHTAEKLTDEQVKTYWLAGDNGDSQWATIDLQKPGKVQAVQINYFDHESDMYGRIPGLRHRYVVEGSLDGRKWEILIDKSNSYRDNPNDYVELAQPERIRYLRYRNIEVPTPHLAISDIRVFGIGEGKKPGPVTGFRVKREDDRRDAMITWNAQKDVQGYNVRWGIAPDKLYSSWLVYDDNQLLLKALTTDQEYYFTIEAFNENGISESSDTVRVR
ncbi:family 43 glycosylhydrolase [uncultured Proteiniphilum sp.]|uniref:family 43 glycosylhydrolase n=1 Tax=uncultured Proteiniphilum sp. TaxID=497637 RepID=UPI00261AEB82|nr:family 43 glycosylhydrolase [uncultured Proteiniphilum sp.]